MAHPRRTSTNAFDIWPGFVDALATLLMVIIFLLMIFVVAQFFLTDAISGRDQALERLNWQVDELADLLALERNVGADLRNNIAQLSNELKKFFNYFVLVRFTYMFADWNVQTISS